MVVQHHREVLAGLVMYEVTGKRQLLGVGQSVYEYHSKIASFHQLDLSAVPYELQTLLGPMLSVAPSARPSAISITGSQYFQVGADILCLQYHKDLIKQSQSAQWSRLLGTA